MDNSSGKFAGSRRDAWTPSEYCRGTLEQGTEALNAKIGPCGELTSRPCVCPPQPNAAGTGSGLRHPHRNDPSYFCSPSPFSSSGSWGGGVKIYPSCHKRWDYTLYQPPVPHKTDLTQNHLGRARLCLSLKIEFSSIYFLSMSHIDT